jgi:hypothetical protein
MSRSEGSDDGFVRWLDSRPIEDEEISAEEAAAIAEAHAELAAGEPTVSLEAFKRELGAQVSRAR